MATEINKDKLNEDSGPGYTTFGGPAQGMTYAYPRGKIGQFFAKFFATPALPYLNKDVEAGGGDTVINPERPARMTSQSTKLPFLPEVEINRKRRYQEYEKMDDYPEITAAFDIYADDSTQRDTTNKRWLINSESTLVVNEVNKLFKKINLRKFYWDIVRNTVKYGDCFIELVADINRPERGLRRIKILNPNYIIRVENAYGYLERFLQEIPDKIAWDSSPGVYMENQEYIELDKNQIVHFRLHTSDPKFYPYGKSIASAAISVFRSLKLMEDAMMVYRLSRAPERRIFYIDVGQLPSSKAEAFIEDIKQRYKKEKFYNKQDGAIDARYNPLSADEDYFVPTRGGAGTKIDTLPGGQNLGETDDVKYFRDKLLATLKIPKDYIVEFDKSPERKANLAQLDVKFARTIVRVQECVNMGLESMAKRHLKLLNFPNTFIKELEINLPDPSDIFTKRKLEIDESKARVVQAVVGTGLFPTETIYKELYDMTDQEIEETKNKLEKEQQEQQEKAQDQQAAEQAAGVPNAEEPVAGNKVVGPAGEAPLPPKATSEDINTIKNYIKHKYNGDNEKIRLIESIDILGTKKI
tara:strand:- start:3451 stop:5199 length:1749 start_codon:yes stop_codon:yes gene_type:complete